MCFELGTDSLTIINPNDGNIMSDKNKDDMRQHLHVGVRISGQNLSVRFIFRVVNQTAIYQIVDDTMFVDNRNRQSDVVNGVLGVDFLSFHRNLSNLYLNTLYKINIKLYNNYS